MQIFIQITTIICLGHFGPRTLDILPQNLGPKGHFRLSSYSSFVLTFLKLKGGAGGLIEFLSIWSSNLPFESCSSLNLNEGWKLRVCALREFKLAFSSSRRFFSTKINSAMHNEDFCNNEWGSIWCVVNFDFYAAKQNCLRKSLKEKRIIYIGQ